MRVPGKRLVTQSEFGCGFMGLLDYSGIVYIVRLLVPLLQDTEVVC